MRMPASWHPAAARIHHQFITLCGATVQCAPAVRSKLDRPMLAGPTRPWNPCSRGLAPSPQSFSEAHRTCGLRCWPAVNNRPASRRRCSRNCRSLAVSPSDRSLLYIAQPLRRLSTASPTATRCEDRDGRVMAVQARRTLIPHTPSPSAPSFRNTSIGLGHFNSKRFHVCVPAG
jgi:hypothetical protein